MFKTHFLRDIYRFALLGCVMAAPAICQTDATPEKAAGNNLRVFDPTLIDKTVDPCDNFYRYSCNGWFKKNPLPPDQTSYGRFTELFELNRLHLRQILEDASVPRANRTPNEQKIGDEYASCMDTATVNKPGITPLKPELDRIAALKSTAELPAGWVRSGGGHLCPDHASRVPQDGHVAALTFSGSAS